MSRIFITLFTLGVLVSACAVSSEPEPTDQQNAELFPSRPACDACCQKGGTWDSSHWMCCWMEKNGNKTCTNRPEDVKIVAPVATFYSGQ